MISSKLIGKRVSICLAQIDHASKTVTVCPTYCFEGLSLIKKSLNDCNFHSRGVESDGKCFPGNLCGTSLLFLLPVVLFAFILPGMKCVLGSVHPSGQCPTGEHCYHNPFQYTRWEGGGEHMI